MKYAYVTKITEGLKVDKAFTDAEAMFAVLKAGDTVVIPHVNTRLFAGELALVEFLEKLQAMDVIISLPEAGLDTSTDAGKLGLFVFNSMTRNLVEQEKIPDKPDKK